MKILVAVVVMLISTSIFSQSIQILPKEWNGSVVFTSIGGVSKFNADKKDEWNYFEAPRSLTILRQKGRHIEAVYKSPDAKLPLWAGTISRDGRQIYFAGKQDQITFNISENKMYGCGIARKDTEGFEGWTNSYGSYCVELTAVK